MERSEVDAGRDKRSIDSCSLTVRERLSSGRAAAGGAGGGPRQLPRPWYQPTGSDSGGGRDRSDVAGVGFGDGMTTPRPHE